MNSSTKPESFSFETEFAENGEILSAGSTAFKRYRQEEVDEMCRVAREEGVQSVQAETERRIAASAEAIVQHLQPVMPFALQLSTELRREASELALLMARQIAGKALDHVPEEAVTECLQETLSQLPAGLKLVLSVHPDIAERIEAAVAPHLPAETELVVAPDAGAAPGAWKLAWESGGFRHDPGQIAAGLEAILNNHLNQPVDEQGDLFAALA